tara:strand:- start:860 stop:1198 length:339 start_codon:yes stop_codon:yes gene_type:complete
MELEDLNNLVVTDLQTMEHSRGLAHSMIISRDGEEILFSNNEGNGGSDSHNVSLENMQWLNGLHRLCKKELNKTESLDWLLMFAEKGKSLSWAMMKAKKFNELSPEEQLASL